MSLLSFFVPFPQHAYNTYAHRIARLTRSPGDRQPDRTMLMVLTMASPPRSNATTRSRRSVRCPIGIDDRITTPLHAELHSHTGLGIWWGGAAVVLPHFSARLKLSRLLEEISLAEAEFQHGYMGIVSLVATV